MEEALGRRSNPQDCLARLFTELERWLRAHQWRGSLAGNAAAEPADPDHPVHQAIAKHRREVRDRLRALAAEAGAADPDEAARQLQLLLDGAMAGARMEHGPGPVRAARDAGRLVLPAAERASLAASDGRHVDDQPVGAPAHGPHEAIN